MTSNFITLFTRDELINKNKAPRQNKRIPLTPPDSPEMSGTPSSTALVIGGWGLPSDFWVDRLDTVFETPFQTIVSLSVTRPQTIVDEWRQWSHAVGYVPSHIIGFSMGGYIAIDIAADYPTIQLDLIGLRPSYNTVILDEMKQTLNEDSHKVMTEFYRACVTTEDDYDRLLTCIDWHHPCLNQEVLLDGLTMLKTVQVTTLSLPPNATLWHGSRDQIAPIRQIKEVASTLRMLKGVGHCPFFSH